MNGLSSEIPAATLDVQGQTCPYPIVLTKKEMERLPAGSVLKIICDSPATAEDAIPRYCEKHAYRYETVTIDDNCWEIYIQKS